MDFNPDSFVIPEDKITRNGMSAAITIGFSDRAPASAQVLRY